MAPLDDAPNFTNLDEDPTHYELLTLSATTTRSTSASDEEMFLDSETSYTASTLQSNEVAAYFRLVDGFTFPSDENIPRIFPTDGTAERIDIMLHIIVRLCRGGKNVPPAIDEMLRTGGLDGGGAKVLDLVTNSGTWVTEMASTYPTARFTSLDTKPLVPHQPNARIDFEVYDWYAGILQPDSSFDLVHLRQGVYETKNFNFLLQEVHRVLKPNGFLMVTEIPTQAYEELDPLVPFSSGYYLVRATALLHEACRAVGADINAWQDMSARLDPSHPMWGNDQTGTSVSPEPDKEPSGARPIRGFHSIHLDSHPIPFGAWPDDEGQKILGNLNRMRCYHQTRSGLPIILMMGMEGSEATEFVEGILQEMLDIDQYKLYRICCIWTARKI